MKKTTVLLVVTMLFALLGISFTSTQSQAKEITDPDINQIILSSLKDTYHKGKPLYDSTPIKPSGDVKNVKILKMVNNKSFVHVLYSFELNGKSKYGLCDITVDNWRVSRNKTVTPSSKPLQIMTFHSSKYSDVIGFVKESETVKTIRITYEDGIMESIDVSDTYIIYYPKHKHADLKIVEAVDESGGSIKIYPIHA
ncbi:hypothetical protein [Brevibacillus invocatus]|uniref:DUF3888 domain-containing protein n=1 Tax=Brevibacillus invocatus TaxID=173959 RepID=A0A3M8C5G0_9BACL|nr:hypothetical protein [Brevibacillus invocatus]MCM3081979.1 hypothetical protein [Brevibacillus invocatus]MCM3432368.1 hypothetical protein [Brevibacillus invocatus]RNB70861.1 hypothetical protein EDM52_16415 [Brevibacillus invocatus]